MHELTCWESSVFVTATYSDEYLPVDGGLHKEHAQLWIKRIRKALGDRPMSYLLCGEYGDKRHRPHYHAIMFGLALGDRELLYDAWGQCEPQAFVVGSVTYDSIRYCTDYVLKKYNGRKAKEIYGNKQAPFRLLSKGLGQQWLLVHEDQVLQQLYVTMHGVKQSLPRYYRKKLEGKIDEERWEANKAERKRLKDEWYEARAIDPVQRTANEIAHRQQVKEEQAHRDARRPKGSL